MCKYSYLVKGGRMLSEDKYTPQIEEVRNAYALWMEQNLRARGLSKSDTYDGLLDTFEELKKEFNRWLAEHDAEVAKAGREKYGSGELMSGPRKYRKMPVVIEAMQWDGTAESAIPIISWANKSPTSIHYWSAEETSSGLAELVIPTLEGDMVAREGDYIICGVQGEFYPCKPDIFAATYKGENNVE
jgi:hypothetical protein